MDPQPPPADSSPSIIPPPPLTSSSNSASNPTPAPAHRIRPETLRRNPNRPVNPLGRTGPRTAACRRCRRIRVKCINTDKNPPCHGCRKAGEECTFPHKGDSALDREYRSPRRLASTTQREQRVQEEQLRILNGDGPRRRGGWAPSSTIASSVNTTNGPFFSAIMYWPRNPDLPRRASRLPTHFDSLPPFDQIVDGVKALASSYFQLGFLPKSLFLDEMRKQPDTMSPFLLFAILSLSARFTPSLVRYFQTSNRTAQTFLARAATLIPDHMFNPTLDSIQGFFLISVAEWANGETNKSSVYMSIAIRLAGMLRMHREETYRLPDTATEEEIVKFEMARRTFWMLMLFEGLHYGLEGSISFSNDEITTLLPCDEGEFTFGSKPAQRAALVTLPECDERTEVLDIRVNSLFATLLQAHHLWRQVIRLVSATVSGEDSLSASPDYERLTKSLINFESQLPAKHQWTIWNLRAFKVEGLDLAYLSVSMILRLSNTILRRGHLHSILRAGVPPTGDYTTQEQTHTQPESAELWPKIAQEMVDNLIKLDSQVNAFFEYRDSEHHQHQDGYPALVLFCVYVCGSLANYLQKQPRLCPKERPDASRILESSTERLQDLRGVSPMVERWRIVLCKASSIRCPMEGRNPGAAAPSIMATTATTDSVPDITASDGDLHRSDGGIAADLQTSTMPQMMMSPRNNSDDEHRGNHDDESTGTPQPYLGMIQFNTPLLSDSMLEVIERCIGGGG